MALTWSWSRHRAFAGCRRRYAYGYYGAKDGWRRPYDDPGGVLYRLKRARTRGQHAGILVHELAASILTRWRDGQAVDEDAAVDDLARRARREVEDARRGLAKLHPRKHVEFVELVYAEVEGDAVWRDHVDDVVGRGRRLLAHPALRRMAEVPDRIVEVEEHRRWWVGGVCVIGAVDVIVRDGRDGLVVVDWKTGRAHTDPHVDGQLAVYALYVTRTHQVAARHVRSMVAAVSTGEMRTRSFEAADLASTEADLLKSAAAMWRLGESTGGVVDAFPTLPEGSDECARCRFRRPCGRE